MLDVVDKQVIRGKSVDIEAVIKIRGSSATPTDRDLTLTDPDSHSIQLFDPDGLLDNTYTDPTSISTGFFYRSIDIDADAKIGLWKVRWTATIGSNNWPEEAVFEVIN